MKLSLVDIVVLIVLLGLTLFIGLYMGRPKKRNLSEFFLGGRSLPWYIAGISMVATTFAADTPLAVTELVGKYGISGNWLWWNLLAGGMLTTVFFAKLWRRSGVTTEVEFIEFRYSGAPAAFLRGLKSIYLGGFMNVLIMGWVNVAMITLLQGFFGLTHWAALGYTAAALLLVVLYVNFSGFRGVVYTDVFQFVLAMAGSITLAVVVLRSPEVGGVAGLKSSLPRDTFAFLPTVSQGEQGSTYQIGLASFLAYFGMIWWTSWYPGAEPGGGGYSAQRMLSTKDERSSYLASMLFQIGHYAVRPWPWILAALAALSIYGSKGDLVANAPEQLAVWLEGNETLSPSDQTALDAWTAQWEPVYGERLYDAYRYQKDNRFGYIFLMRDFLPKGVLGMLLASFFAAYMSTMSTQLNWGASYLINDLYLRFLRPNNAKSQSLSTSRWTIVALAILGLLITLFMDSIAGVWSFIMECGAGLGLVLILRWYWWRINAWVEIVATLAPFLGYAIAHSLLDWAFPNSFFFTVSFTTVAWLLTLLFTQPTSMSTLVQFYATIRPPGQWKNVSLRVPADDSIRSTPTAMLVLQWLGGIAAVYGALFLSGYVLLQLWK